MSFFPKTTSPSTISPGLYFHLAFAFVKSSKEITIKNLAELVKNIVGYKGRIKFDRSKPDGTLSKLMNNSRIKKLNWKNEINLEEGISRVYSEFIKDINNKK